MIDSSTSYWVDGYMDRNLMPHICFPVSTLQRTTDDITNDTAQWEEVTEPHPPYVHGKKREGILTLQMSKC